jgi:hypothetical protein
MREVNGSELLAGSDHEFVVNLYTVILNRWPDEDGYRHYLQRIENRPDIRRQAIQDVAGSAEARALDVVLTFADDPPPDAAPAAAATVPTGNAGDALAALLATLGTVPDTELRTLHRQLADALGAVAAERDARLEARLARLEQRLG